MKPLKPLKIDFQLNLCSDTVVLKLPMTYPFNAFHILFRARKTWGRYCERLYLETLKTLNTED